MRIMRSSDAAKPTLVMTVRKRALISGKPRSASVMAKPHNGNAGHAIERRSRASTSSASFTPAAFNVFMMSAFQEGSTSVSNKSCCAVKRTGSS